MKLRCVRCGADFKVPDATEGVVACPICGARYRRGPSSGATSQTVIPKVQVTEPTPPTPPMRAIPPITPVSVVTDPPSASSSPLDTEAPTPRPATARTPSAAVSPPRQVSAPASAGQDTPTRELAAQGDAHLPIFFAGDLVAGRYKIKSFLARGGMGEVYEAEDLELNSEVALKTVDPRVAEDERAIERFKREIQLARRVTHPNACRIFDVGFHPLPHGSAIVFLTMELLRGETLAARLRREGPMPPATALPVLRQVAAGLGAAHKAGIIHRDFKSENVFLVPDPGEEAGLRAVVADFGIARGAVEDAANAKLTMAGGVIGTPAYMSPEQLSGDTMTSASDIYALGLVMYEVVTGRLPFQGDTAIATAVKRLTEPPPSPRTYVPDLDRRWEAVILHCLERRPEDRYSTALEAIAALEPDSVVRSASFRVQPSAPAAGGLRGLLRQRWTLAVLALLLLAAAGSAVLRVRANRQAQMGSVGAPRRAVAVLGFKNSSARPESAWISTALAEMLNTELGQGDGLRLVPGESVARVKIDLALGDVDSLSPATLGKLRTLLGADYVLAGSYTALPGGALRLDLRLQDALAGETLKPVTASGTEAGLFDLAQKSGEQLRERLGVESGSQGSGWWSAERWNPEATRLYSEGLTKLRGFEPQAARQLLEQAVAADPQSPLAHSALAAAWSALGFGEKAAQEGKKALDLSADLPREQKLEVEGRYAEVTHDSPRAAEVYGALFGFYPDNLDYGLRLASNLTAAGHADRALSTVEALRQLPAPLRDDPRIDLEAASAAGARSDFKLQQQTAARAAGTAATQGARLLVAQARVIEGWAWRNLGDPGRSIAACQEAEKLYREVGNRAGQAAALTAWAGALYDQGELPGAKAGYEQALATYREIGDQNGVARALNNIAVVLKNQGDLTSAKAMYEQTLAICRETGDKMGIASTLNNEAAVLSQEGNLQAARDLFEQALTLRRELGDQSGIAYALSNIGGVLRLQGDLAGARAKHEEALNIRNSINQRIGSVASLNNLGRVLLDTGNLIGAKKEFDEALNACGEIQNKSCSANALSGLAEVALLVNEPESAVRQAQEALSIREQIGERSSAAESRLLLAWIANDSGDFSTASKTLTAVVEDLAAVQATDQQAIAAALLARARLGAGDKSGAQRAASQAATLAKGSQNRLARLAATIAAARVGALVSAANRASAIETLRQARREAEASGLILQQYEARLAIGEIEMAAADRMNGRTELISLAADAARQGYPAMARRAANAAKG
ncbi:MAG: tetratricopeptide repeat protein [Acidobacteriota bacterium]